MDRTRALALFEAIAPLKIRWFGQIGVHAANDDELLAAMNRSGCMGVLVGFESLNPQSKAIGAKGIGASPESFYRTAAAQFAKHRIALYGTFIFGYDEDTKESIRRAAEFASQNRLFFAAFNHLVPFPGTPLHQRLSTRKRLIRDDWWLSPDYRFGDLAFRPENLAPADLATACFQARKKFYSWRQILKRATNFRSNCRSPFMTAAFFSSNLLSRREVDKRQGLPLGVADE